MEKRSVRAQRFVCEEHKEYLEKCGVSIEADGVEYCFAYLYTQGIIDDETNERVYQIEDDEIESVYQIKTDLRSFVSENIYSRRDEAKRIGEKTIAKKWSALAESLLDKIRDDEEIEALVMYSNKNDEGIFDVVLVREVA